MFLTKTISALIEDGYRTIKVFVFGEEDVQTPNEVMPFGLDSCPTKDVLAAYSSTSATSDNIIIGYYNKNQKAAAGEYRTYATDSEGVEAFYTWMKADGTMEIGGDTDNMVRYSELETAFNELKSDFNDLVSKYNSHIHTTTATIGTGPVGVISPTATTGTPTAADITPSKIEEIKTL